MQKLLTVSSLLYKRCSIGVFLVIPSIMRLSSRTVVFSLASKKMVIFLRRIIRNTSMMLLMRISAPPNLRLAQKIKA